MEFKLISEGAIRQSDLDTMDGMLALIIQPGCNAKQILVFIADTGKSCFVWIGSRASPDEKKLALQYAHVRGYKCDER